MTCGELGIRPPLGRDQGMTMEKSVSLAFPTPIGRYRLPRDEAAAINKELRPIILQRERCEDSQNHANAGGWHSQRDLLEWPYPVVGRLRSHLLETVEHMARSAISVTQTADHRAIEVGPLTIKAWANVSRRGNYHRIHNHPRSCWSGVYYVAVGTETPGYPLSGLLELMDPRPFTEMVDTPGEPFGQKLVIPPEAGTIIVFPSWIYHFVNPYHGDGERISIAFNAAPLHPLDADP
jgi:uncharacterized protein (TIGR02466 family)